MDKKERTIPAGQFKQKCLAILDEVAQTHRSVVISKRGKPVARLAPLENDQEIEDRILFELRRGEGGMLVDEETFLLPSSKTAGWRDI